MTTSSSAFGRNPRSAGRPSRPSRRDGEIRPCSFIFPAALPGVKQGRKSPGTDGRATVRNPRSDSHDVNRCAAEPRLFAAEEEICCADYDGAVGATPGDASDSISTEKSIRSASPPSAPYLV